MLLCRVVDLAIGSALMATSGDIHEVQKNAKQNPHIIITESDFRLPVEFLVQWQMAWDTCKDKR